MTPGLQRLEGDLPFLPVPQSLWACPTLLLALRRQVPALGSPARVQHQATAQPSSARALLSPVPWSTFTSGAESWERVSQLEEHLFNHGCVLMCSIHCCRCLHPKKVLFVVLLHCRALGAPFAQLFLTAIVFILRSGHALKGTLNWVGCLI